MKLTWFGGTTLRVYVGGEIVVVDAEGAPAGIDRGELLAGADRVIKLSGDKELQAIDPAGWRPRAVPKLLDDAAIPVAIWRIGEGAVLVEGAGEPPLVLLGGGAPPRFGRWADGAVIVLLGASGSLVATATVLLYVSRVKLIALAADEQALDVVIDELSEHLDGAGLVSLEPGLALEV
jgi:hypothetical protein